MCILNKESSRGDSHARPKNACPILKVNLEAHLFRLEKAYLSSRNRRPFPETKISPEGSGRFAKANSDNRFANCPFLRAFRKFRLLQR